MDYLIIIFLNLILAITGYAIGRHKLYSLQNSSEAFLSHQILKYFHPPNYHLLNNVTLPILDGTTQVDHILVSRFGVFVIETKDYKGWIFADKNSTKWTQVLYKSKFKFNNPIYQNYKHTKTVRDLLDFLQPEAIKSAVVFTGDAEFKTPIPQGVFRLDGFIEHLQTCKTEILSLNRVQFCVGRLETTRFALTEQTDIEHVQRLQRKYGT